MGKIQLDYLSLTKRKFLSMLKKITGMSQEGIDLLERNADKKTRVRDGTRADDG